MKTMVFIVLSIFIGAGMLYAQQVVGSEQKAPEQKAPELKPADKPPEEKVTGTASMATLNRYIFRGYRIGESGLVLAAISYRFV